MITNRRHLLVPVAAAAIIRLVHLGFLAARDPLFAKPVVDAWFHANQASQILEGSWLLSGTGAYYKGPLYSYLLALLFSVFGTEAGVVCAKLLSIALGCTSVLLIARIAEQLGGVASAWIAGLAAAAYGTSVYYDTTMLLVPLVAAGLLFAGERLLNAAQVDDPSRTARSLAIAGAVLGIVSITRANGLLALFAGALWAAAAAGAGRWAATGTLRAAATVLLPGLVVIAPVTVRNAFLERDPVVISWNGGINLFMGNDPAFDQGSGNWHPDLSWTRLYDAPRKLGRERGADHQRFFLAQASSRAAAAPTEQLKRFVHKALLLASPYEIQNNRRIEPAKQRSPVLAILLARAGKLALPLTVAGPLIVAGLVLGGRRRLVRAMPLLALAAAWGLTPVLFFNTARFRLPLLLLLLPVAAAGWASVSSATLPRLRRRLVVATAASLAWTATGMAVFPENPALPPSDTAQLAVVAEREGRRDDALALWRQAVAEEPADPTNRIRLADRLRNRREFREAAEHYRSVIENRELASDWHNAAARSLARSHFGLGEIDSAIQQYREFLARDPDAPMTGSRPDFHLRGVPPLQACAIRMELATVLFRADERAAALVELAKVIEQCDRSDALASAAQAQLRELATGVPSTTPQD